MDASFCQLVRRIKIGQSEMAQKIAKSACLMRSRLRTSFPLLLSLRPPELARCIPDDVTEDTFSKICAIPPPTLASERGHYEALNGTRV